MGTSKFEINQVGLEYLKLYFTYPMYINLNFSQREPISLDFLTIFNQVFQDIVWRVQDFC